MLHANLMPNDMFLHNAFLTCLPKDENEFSTKLHAMRINNDTKYMYKKFFHKMASILSTILNISTNKLIYLLHFRMCY